jgi:cellulose biosynthesis protein BcsQ
MIGKIISVVNRKGGVGKTTLTLALADTLVGDTEKPYHSAAPIVVAVDLDPQGSLTRALLHDPSRPTEQGRLKAAMDEKRTLAAALQSYLKRPRSSEEFLTHGVGPSGYSYSLLANESNAWNVERRALKSPGEAKLKQAVRAMLQDLVQTYRYVLVDSPPGQTVMAEAAIQASDLVLCPTTADLLSYWGLESFDEYLRDVCSQDQYQPPARFVFTKYKIKPPKYDPQDKVHKLVEQFKRPERYVTLLKEIGDVSAIGGGTIVLPFDPKLIARLEGSPKPGRRWPWERVYTQETQAALRRLVSAVRKELDNGQSRGAVSGDRASDRANTVATRGNPQVS